jgi:hypothetical protein
MVFWMFTLRVVENHSERWDKSLQQDGLELAFPKAYRAMSRAEFFNTHPILRNFMMEALDESLQPAAEPLDFLRNVIYSTQTDAERDYFNIGIDKSQWEYESTLHQRMREVLRELKDLSWPKIKDWS